MLKSEKAGSHWESRQADHRRQKLSRVVEVRAMHEQMIIRMRSLVHACVATVPVSSGEMTADCLHITIITYP